MFQFHIVRLKVGGVVDLISPSKVSIPYSSIKRPSWTTTPLMTSMFQFHIVRLKARAASNICFTYWFQFHIVRLKEWTEICSTGCRLVSIPYSSIKRQEMEIRKTRTARVSIPYSSIKRSSDIYPTMEYRSFNSI